MNTKEKVDIKEWITILELIYKEQVVDLDFKDCKEIADTLKEAQKEIEEKEDKIGRVHGDPSVELD